MASPLLIVWGVSTMSGWGVYGLNLLRHWQGVSGSPAYTVGQIHLQSLAGMDPLSLRALAPVLVESDQMRIRREAHPEEAAHFDGLVLHALGNRFSGTPWPSAGGITGHSTSAVIFFEDTILPGAARIASEYELIVAGSTWCEDVLRGNGVGNVKTVIQGVDPSLFHPAPKSGALEDRFAVFSGGKLEHRKAQDLVVLAFKAFALRHPEAILVTAWHSPWPQAAASIVNSGIVPVTFQADGKIDMGGWAAANGIGSEQFIDLGELPNHLMARVLREMDVAVFPNRCEGGTNLVAMECMACGVPTIVSDNTGHKDLVAAGAPYVLARQDPVASPLGHGTDGWGESNVDEIVEMLEAVWADRDKARRQGLVGAEAMAKWSWRQQIACLRDALGAVNESQDSPHRH